MVIFKHTSFVLGGVDEWAGLVRAERPRTLVINCDLVAQGYFLTSVSIQVRKPMSKIGVENEKVFLQR